MNTTKTTQKDYSIPIILSLLTLLLLLTACQPKQAQVESPSAVVAKNISQDEPAIEDSNLQVKITPAEKTESADASRAIQLDEIDNQLFQRTSEMFELFRNKSDQIWNAGYRLDQMPLMYVRTDGEKDQYAYLINHPKAKEIAGGQLVELPAALNLPPVYRFDSIPNAELISGIPNFTFNEIVAGEEVYLMKYTTPEVDQFSSPVSHDWSLFVAHEGLHDYQFQWKEAPSNGQDTAGYPLEADHIALIMLEDAAIKAALTASGEVELEIALKQLVAIRQTRINRWDSVRLLDLPQEQIEGTARFIEHRLGSLVGFDSINNDSFVAMLDEVPESQIRDALAFGRFYSTGAALTHLVAQLDIPNWSVEIEKGKSQFDLLAKKLNLSEDEIVTQLEDAKVKFGFDNMLPKAEKVAKTAASEPTDIWGDTDS